MVASPREGLATDGVVRAGHSTLDLSAIIGESVPIEFGHGTEVFAASINGGGVLDVEVTARTSESLAEVAVIAKGVRTGLCRPFAHAATHQAGDEAVEGGYPGRDDASPTPRERSGTR